MTDNIRKNKDQHNDAIDNKSDFDNNSFKLSSGTRNPLPLVTVSLLGDNKYRAATVAGTTCLWDSGATNSMINK